MDWFVYDRDLCHEKVNLAKPEWDEGRGGVHRQNRSKEFHKPLRWRALQSSLTSKTS